MLVFGTRPEAIKMAPLVKAFQKESDKFKTIICVTGQHREMLDQVLAIFEIKPDYDLNIMKQEQDLYDVTARVLTGMRDVLKEVHPDVVLVHGDTTTSTAAALAAFYQQIPVGHVEAGLRTHNIYSPWPEEMNRQITGRIAAYHFSPTSLSRQNLLNEGIKEEAITVTGNTAVSYTHLDVYKRQAQVQVNLPLFLILSMNLFFIAIGCEWFYQGMEDFKYITIRGLIVKMLSVALLFVLVKDRSDLLYYGVYSVVGVVGGNIFNAFRLRKYIKFHLLELKELHPMRHLIPALRIFLLNVVASIYLQLDTVMLGFLKGNDCLLYTSTAQIDSYVRAAGAQHLKWAE